MRCPTGEAIAKNIRIGKDNPPAGVRHVRRRRAHTGKWVMRLFVNDRGFSFIAHRFASAWRSLALRAGKGDTFGTNPPTAMIPSAPPRSIFQSPDAAGFFGKYGGVFVPPELETPLAEVRKAFTVVTRIHKHFGVPVPVHDEDDF